MDDNKIIEKFEFLQDIDIDGIDIHFNEIDFLSNIKKIDLICNLFKEKIISVNLSRKRLSNVHMVELLKECFGSYQKKFNYRSRRYKSYENNFSNILQTISTADIINKKFIQQSPKYKKYHLY